MTGFQPLCHKRCRPIISYLGLLVCTLDPNDSLRRLNVAFSTAARKVDSEKHQIVNVYWYAEQIDD